MFDFIFFLLLKLKSRVILDMYQSWYIRTQAWKKSKDLTKSYGGVVNLLASESKKGVEVITTGDSVIFGGHLYWESIKGVEDKSIPGDAIDRFIKRIVENILIFNPTVVYLHIGGNDFLEVFVKNGSISDNDILSISEKVTDAIKKIKMHPSIKRVVYQEILPLGREHNIINAATTTFNRVMKAKAKAMPQVFEVLSIRDVLANSDGYIRDDFRSSDGIHPNDSAYKQAWFPFWKEHLEKTLLKYR